MSWAEIISIIGIALIFLTMGFFSTIILTRDYLLKRRYDQLTALISLDHQPVDKDDAVYVSMKWLKRVKSGSYFIP